MILLRIALRNILRHSTRSLITLSAIAFGCISIIVADGFFNDLFRKARESYIRQHTGHIQIYRKGYSENGVAKPFDFLIEKPDQVLELVSKISGVQYVTTRLQFSGLVSTGENTVGCFGVSIEPEFETMNYETGGMMPSESEKLGVGSIVEGKPLEPGNEFGVLLGTGLAANLGVKPGAGIILLSNTVGGSMNALDVNVVGTFRTSLKEYDDRALRIPLPTAKSLLHTEAVQSIMIVLKSTDDTAAAMESLRDAFKAHGLDLEMKSWKDLNAYYFQMRELFGRFFLVLIVVIVVVVILSIFNTMNMAVLERTIEIGTIRALGYRRAAIVKLFLLEGLVLGALGGISGAVLGVGVATLIARVGILMPPPPGATFYWLSQPEVSGGAIVTALIISIATAVVSSIYPAKKASKLEIAEALRHVT